MPVLAVPEALAVIDSFLAGELDAAELEAWAERHECSEDLDYAEPGRQSVIDALFLLANPAINGALTPERVRAVRAGLLGNE